MYVRITSTVSGAALRTPMCAVTQARMHGEGVYTWVNGAQVSVNSMCCVALLWLVVASVSAPHTDSRDIAVPGQLSRWGNAWHWHQAMA